MLNELEEVKYYQDNVYKFESKMMQYKHMRDLWIVRAFEAGNRQRDIGQVCRLSESTIKHITAKLRKDRT